MSWQADCRYFNFTEDAIRASAPEESGVYGLYNFNYQIFIGESENIQEALLRHQRETDFQFSRYRPSGFTFETCPADARKRRAHDLIEKYRPVLQIETEFIDQRSPTANTIEQPTFRGSYFREYKIDNHEFSAEGHDSQQTVSRRSFAGAQRPKLAAMYLLSAAVIFYLGILTGENLQKRATTRSEDALSRMPLTLSPAEHDSSDATEEIVSAVKLADDVPNPSIGWTPQLEIAAPGSTLEGRDRVAVQDTLGVMGSGLVSPPAKSNPTAQPLGSSDRNKQWSVQIFSAPV